MGTASTSASTMPPPTEGVSATTRATAASTEGMSAPAEAASTTAEGTAASTEATVAPTEPAAASTIGIPASTGVTVTDPTAESSAARKATASKATSSVEATIASAPRPGANKDSAREPAWSVVAVGCASVGIIAVVAIRANRRWPHVDWSAVWIPIALALALALALARARTCIALIARILLALIPAWIHIARIGVGIVIRIVIRIRSTLGMRISGNHQAQTQQRYKF